MPIKTNINIGDRVVCNSARNCIRTDCNHYHAHIHETTLGHAHKCCAMVTWCGEIEGWVQDRKVWEIDEECECDPNYAFKKKRQL